MFTALDDMEKRLGQSRFLLGNYITGPHRPIIAVAWAEAA